QITPGGCVEVPADYNAIQRVAGTAMTTQRSTESVIGARFDADSARQRAFNTRSRAIKVAMELAGTEEQLPATFSRLAGDRTADAERLRALSLQAREQAARERQWASAHALASPDGEPDGELP